MAVRYRYQFADLLTDQVIGELPLTDVNFDRRIIQAGSFQARMPVPNRKVADQVKRVVPTLGEMHTGPGRTVVHAWRRSALWGTYLLWRAEPKSDERGRISVDFQGASLESYLHHREIRANLTYTGQDQTSGIAAGLISHMQAVPSGSIGLTITAPASGQPRDRTYRRSEAATYGQRLEELANVLDGFEWMIRTYVDGGERRREFVTGYPQLGADVPAADWVFQSPGNIIAWSYPADATGTATSYQARGDTVQDDVAADSEPLLSDEHHAAGLLAAGWPRLDRTVDYSSVILKSTLDDYARWWATTRPGVIRVPQITVRLPASTPVDPNQLGRYARLKIVDDWFPPGPDGEPTFAQRWRVIGLGVEPVSRETGQEKVTLIFAEEEEEAA